MTRDKKLEALVLVIWFIAVTLLIVLVWQFFLGPLYEAENKHFNAHFILAAGVMNTTATRQQCLDLFFGDTSQTGYVQNLAGQCWKLLQ